MWYEERSGSWNNMKMSSIVLEEWRDLWSFKADFLLSCAAYVFATTNLLNLPKLIIDNGGLTYVCVMGAALIVCILPLILMELTIGQLTGRAPVQAFFNICPIFKGVGMAQVIFSLAVMAYTAIYTCWLLLFTFYYFWSIANGNEHPPWFSCNENSWPCVTAFNMIANDTSVDHFFAQVERSSGSLAEVGRLQWQLLSALALLWILVFLAIFSGVRWLGKVVYFTYCLPVVLLIGLLVKIATLDGVSAILLHVYHLTDWRRLHDYRVSLANF